jgi:hypothetical protein
MSVTRESVLDLVRAIPDDKLESAYDFLAYLYYANPASEEDLKAEDEKWDRLFASNPEALERLAREAHEDYLAGRTTGIDDSGDELKPAP